MDPNNHTVSLVTENRLNVHTNYDLWRLGILGILFAVGAPVNTLIFYRLVRRIQITRSCSRIALLNLNLNISDLLVMYTYVLGEIVWLICLNFNGGRYLCKVYKFSNAFAFSISSFVVVCISLDRLFCVALPLSTRSAAKRRAKRMLIVAWTLAIACSVPQMFTWETVEI